MKADIRTRLSWEELVEVAFFNFGVRIHILLVFGRSLRICTYLKRRAAVARIEIASCLLSVEAVVYLEVIKHLDGLVRLGNVKAVRIVLGIRDFCCLGWRPFVENCLLRWGIKPLISLAELKGLRKRLLKAAEVLVRLFVRLLCVLMHE